MSTQIIYTCSCGKRFTYSAKHAGRHAQCVECKKEYTVPGCSDETTPNIQSDDDFEINGNFLISDTDMPPFNSDTVGFDEDIGSVSLPKPKIDHEKNTSSKVRSLNNYRVVSVLSRGGMGRVSLAQDTILDRLVAIKEIRSKYVKSSTFRKRLVQEAKITGFLNHPGIVPVYALETDELGCPFYVMRRIHGISFEEAIEQYHKEKNKAKLKDLLRRFIDICQVVAYAHNEGVIHRDIKPSNLMIGGFGATFVLDWGLAKKFVERKNIDELSSVIESQEHEHLTQINARVGTKWYKAPEYLKTGESHPMNDIYALGMVLYKILTQRLPYDDSQMSERRALDIARAKPPHDVMRAIPKPLSAICMKAIARDMVLRYKNALHLADDVQKWLENEPVSAYQYTLAEKVKQYFLRWKKD